MTVEKDVIHEDVLKEKSAWEVGYWDGYSGAGYRNPYDCGSGRESQYDSGYEQGVDDRFEERV